MKDEIAEKKATAANFIFFKLERNVSLFWEGYGESIIRDRYRYFGLQDRGV